MTQSWARGAAVVAPVVVAAGLALARDVLANPGAALVLVLVVVAVAVTGDRLAGVLAAVVAAGAFDFFLSPPYLSFAIVGRDDVEIAVLLIGLGVAITEVVQWGRRQEERAGRRAGYLAGVAIAARMAGEGASDADLVASVGRMIAETLDLDDCRFETGLGRVDRPTLAPDGSVTWLGAPIDVARDGLPTMDVVELPVGTYGRYLLTASTRVRRPDLESLLVVCTLAEQVGMRVGVR